jgi:hypothetical protein
MTKDELNKQKIALRNCMELVPEEPKKSPLNSIGWYLKWMTGAQSVLTCLTIPAFILMLLLNRPMGKALQVFIAHPLAIAPLTVPWVFMSKEGDE